MNISPMPMAASRSTASNATIMAMPRWDFSCFVDFPFMFLTSVVYQTRHSRHAHLHVLVRVRIFDQALGRYSDLDALDFGQCRRVRDRCRQINRRPGCVKRGKNWLAGDRNNVLYLCESSPYRLGG